MLDTAVARLFFRPSHHYIPCEKRELCVPYGSGTVQIWREYSGVRCANGEHAAPELFVMRFLGSRGRAEMATLDPVDRLPRVSAEVWTVNAPGFGTSSGPATLQNYCDSAIAAYERMRHEACGRRCWVTGKSLGATVALHVAANLGADGLILRNAMPLSELIIGHYAWWNLWLPAWFVANQIPCSLNCISNARQCDAPALVLISRKDKVVPPAYQQRITSAYAGEMDVLYVAGAHDERKLSADDEVRYRAAVRKLWASEPAFYRRAEGIESKRPIGK